jgi:Zn-finger nucleic acid-binding protein
MFKTADHNNRLVLIADHLKNKLQYKSISMSYVDKLRRAEVAYYYQRVYNPLSKTFCYLVDPPVTNTKITNLQANPFVDSVELQKLNAHINNLMDRLSRDGNIEYSQICEGDYSEKTLQFITPRFPWDNVELIRPPITADLSIRKHGVWVTRGNLMRSISGRRIPAPSTPAKETPSHHSQQSSESLDKSKLTDVHTTLPQNTYSNQISDSKLILSSTPVLSTNGNFSASERTPPDIYASQISKNQETQNISPEDCRRLITFPKSQEQNPVVIDSGKDESISVHKRKHYDSVAITVGGGKKQKKTLKLASIKSYFTVPVNKDLNS